MNLEDQISQIINPQEFTKLCNAIFTAIHSNDYQVIDGTRADEGNDGYVRSEERIIAIHCPIKPERKTDRDYIEKIRSDLKMAVKLNESGKYQVKNWTFVTPRKLSSNIVSLMISEAKQLELNANHQEATFLASALLRNEHLISEFPFLHITSIDSKLNEILTQIKNLSPQDLQQDSEINDSHVYKDDTKNNDDFDRVIELRASRNNKAELKSYFYKSTDPIVQINAILGLLDLYDMLDDTSESMVELCENGFTIASQNGSRSLQAFFQAQKGFHLSQMYSMLDMQTSTSIRMGNAIGVTTVTEDRIQEVIERLNHLEDQYKKAFNDALALAKVKPDKEVYDFKVLTAIFTAIGIAAGGRAFYLRMLGVKDRANAEEKMTKSALLAAKSVSATLGDELGVAHAIYNMANQIRSFGEKEEALLLIETAVKTAKKLNDSDLLKKAGWLRKSIETGKIPDYIHGERRE
ncbi:MAG: hypothetical protein ACUZ8I_11930 [Candidatus Scalindua sp.]